MNLFDQDPDYDFGDAFDSDGDVDGDLDGDFDTDDGPSFFGDRDETPMGMGFGRGSERHDLARRTMPMTRRDEPWSQTDIDSLYESASRDTERFLSPRRDRHEPPNVGNLLVGSAEVVGGAMAAAYLAQRLKRSGAIVPVGIVLGLLAHVAAYMGVVGEGGPHLARFGTGLLAGAGAAWAAGYGSLAAEGVDAPNVQTGAAFDPSGAAPPQMTPPPQVPQNVYSLNGQAPLSAEEYAAIFRRAA